MSKWPVPQTSGTVLANPLFQNGYSFGPNSVNSDDNGQSANNSMDDDEYRDSDESQLLQSSIDDKFDAKRKLTFAIIGSLLSSLLLSCCSVIVKYLKDIHAGELTLVRYLGLLVFCAPFLAGLRLNPFGPRGSRRYLFVSGLIGCSAIALRFFSLHYLPIGDASVIAYSSPIIAAVFAAIFLKDTCALIKVLAVALTIVGIAFTAKIPLIIKNRDFGDNSINSSVNSSLNGQNNEQSYNHIFGISAAFASSLLTASAFMLSRKISGINSMVIMFNVGWIAVIESSVITASFRAFTLPYELKPCLLLVALAFLTFLDQLLLARLRRFERLGPMSALRNGADIGLAFVWQTLFFGDIPDLWSISGAVLVTMAIVLVKFRSWILLLPDSSKIKQKFECFVS